MALKINKQIRFFTWTIKGFFVKHGLILSLSLFLGIFSFLFISKLIPYLPKIKKKEKIGLIGKITIDQLPDNVSKLLGQGLVGLNDDGTANNNGLAKNWIISEDGLDYTFTLKDNLTWVDNKPILADQIVYDFKNVERQIIDDKTLKFILQEPFVPFITVLNKPILKKGYIGSGPYKIESFKISNNFLETLHLSGPNKDILYHFYPTVELAKIGFKLGEIDILEDLFINPFEDNWLNNINMVQELKTDRYIGLFLNNEDSNLGNKSLRQALNYALKMKPTDETRAYGPINQSSWAYNPNVKSYDYDPENAKNLLKKVNEENNSSSQINLTISTSPAFLSLAEEIKKSWEETLNIKVEVQIINAISENYQVFLGMQEIPSDPDQYALWHSTRPENITHFKDNRIDKLLEDGRKILDIAKRKEKYLDFQRFLLEELPVIFISHPYFYRISRK